MATLRQKLLTEQATRELLKRNGLPEPDGVEYGHTCIRLFFDEPKVVLIIDIDEPPDEETQRRRIGRRLIPEAGDESIEGDSAGPPEFHEVGLTEMLGQDDTLEFDVIDNSEHEPGWLELKRDYFDGDPN